MYSFFAHSQYMPCSECGASVKRCDEETHECDPERRLDYQVFQLREEIAAVEDEVAAYLESPHGRFELFCAERERRRR